MGPENDVQPDNDFDLSTCSFEPIEGSWGDYGDHGQSV